MTIKEKEKLFAIAAKEWKLREEYLCDMKRTGTEDDRILYREQSLFYYGMETILYELGIYDEFMQNIEEEFFGKEEAV